MPSKENHSGCDLNAVMSVRVCESDLADDVVSSADEDIDGQLTKRPLVEMLEVVLCKRPMG